MTRYLQNVNISPKLQNWTWAAGFAVQEYYRGENWYGVIWQQPYHVINLEPEPQSIKQTNNFKSWETTLVQNSKIGFELLILRCRNTTEGKIGMEWQQPSLVINLELIICSLIYWETFEHYKLSVKNWLLQIRATIIMHYVCSLLLFHCGLTFLFLSKTCEVCLT